MISTKSFDNSLYAKTIDQSTLYDIIEEDVKETISATPSGSMSDGTAATPGLEFALDTDTGIYRVGANNFGISTNGVLRFDISTSNTTSTLPYLAPLGSLSSVSYGFSGDPNTGIYSSGADDLSLVTNGVDRFNINGTQITSTLPTYNISGSILNPAISFTGDTDTGIYRRGANNLGISCGNNLVLNCKNASVGISNDHLYVGETSGNTKSIYFSNSDNVNSGINYIYSKWEDGNTKVQLGLKAQYNLRPTETANPVSDTGRYSTLKFVKNNQIGEDISGAGEVELMRFTDQGEVLLSDGTVSNPSLSFINDDNTGLYCIGTDNLGFTTGGSLRFDISSSAITSTLNLVMPADSTILNAGNDGLFIDDTGSSVGLQTAGFKNLILNSTTSSIQCTTLNLRPPTVLDTSAHWHFEVGDGISSWTNVLDLDDSNADFAVNIHIPNGTAALPALVFNGDTDTGFYRIGTDNLGFSTNGVLRLDISTSAVTSTLPIINTEGSTLRWTSADFTLGNSTFTDGTNTFTGVTGSGHYFRNNFAAGNASDWVQCYLTVSWTGKGSATGNMILEPNIPVNNGDSDIGVEISYNDGITCTGRLTAEISAGTDEIFFYDQVDDGTAPTRLAASAFDTAGTLRMVLHYPNLERT